MFDRGLYQVDGKTFDDKIQAILEANKTKSNISWEFHRDLFESLDWTVEPELSLSDCYALRAQQIRDSFDYVVVMCSGGADSTNVVDSFLNNDIFIDEAIASAPLSGLSSWEFNDTDIDGSNFASEVKFAQLPFMEKIRARSSKTKLTLNDYFPLLIGAKPDTWVYKVTDALHPTAIGHYNLELLTDLKKLAETGKTIAIVFGYEKPYLMKKDGALHYVLFDVSLNLMQYPFANFYENVHVVPFYIPSNFPQFIIKQSHELAKWICKKENKHIYSFMYDFERDKNLSVSQRRKKHSAYDRGIRSGLYPNSFDPSVFQTNKLNRVFYADMDYWFYSLHQNTYTHQAMLAEFHTFTRGIDRKYFNNDRTGFVTFSNSYLIGKENSFKS